MNERFDDISRILATPMPRRKVLQLLLGVLTGATALTFGTTQAKGSSSDCPNNAYCVKNFGAGFTCDTCPSGKKKCCGPTKFCYDCPNGTTICCTIVAGQACVKAGPGASCLKP